MRNVGQLIRDANPIQGEPSLLADDELNALLLLAQSRSGNVDVQELTKPVEPYKKQRSGWLVAATAFAVVIVFIGAVMLLANPTDELPPATTPPTTQAVTPTTQAVTPTTDAAPPTSEVAQQTDNTLNAETQQFVDDFFATFNSSEYEGVPGEYVEFLGFFADDAVFTTSMLADTGMDVYRGELGYYLAMNTQWSVVSCSEEFGLTRCQIDASVDSISHYQDPFRIGITLKIEDGAVTKFNLADNNPVVVPALDLFYEWVSVAYPGTGSIIQLRDGSPNRSEESIALWISLVAEYHATLDE
jgi:hypothetical protein